MGRDGGQSGTDVWERAIDLAKTVRDRRLDPFDVDIIRFFDRIRPLLGKTKNLHELRMDLMAVLGLSDVVSLQEEWIVNRSSYLYLDPIIALMRIESLDARDLAEVLVQSLHPLAEKEQLTVPRLREARDYWDDLPDVDERITEPDAEPSEAGSVTLEDLDRMGLIGGRTFDEWLRELRAELNEAAGDDGISYWEFVGSETYEQTVFRAYLVSHLCSLGHATLEVSPLEDEIVLFPLSEKPVMKDSETESVPISIDHGRMQELHE